MSGTADARAPRRRGRRTLALLALVALAPIVASYVAYYVVVPERKLNYGELLPTAPAPALDGMDATGAAFSLASLRGRWILLVVADGACDARCERLLYATRQARTMQAAEQDRVARVWLMPSGARAAIEPTLLAAHPGLQVAFVPADALARLPLVRGPDPTLLLLDTRGNLVLRYGADPDIKRLAADLTRLLRASQIGSAPMLKYALDARPRV
jgi:hypothetical protein